MSNAAETVSIDVYEPGDVPDLGVVPPRMLAQVIRAERFGEPRDAFKLEAVPVNGEIHVRDYVPREESAGPTLLRKGDNGHADETLAEIA